MHTQIQIFANIATSNLPRRQKNGILCVLCVNAASFWANTAYFLAASTYNRPSTVFWLSMRQSDRKILEGEARQGGSPFPRTKKAPAGARRRACLCPRHRDDEQRHTSPGAAGVFEGAAPPVLKCGQRDNYRTNSADLRSVYLLGAQMVDIDSPINALTSGQLTSSNITGMGSASASSK